MEPLTLLLGGFLAITIIFFTSKYTYWKRRNVPGPTPIPLLGNYTDFFIFRRTAGETIQKLYQQFPKAPFIGAYYGTEPVLIPRDPEVIKTILTKDFYSFSGRQLVDHEFRDPLLSSNLFFASGDNWKTLRQSFSPMFSSAKLKNMFHLVTESGRKLETHLDQKCKETDVLNMKIITQNFTLDVIGPCIFGMKFDTITLEENVIRDYANKLMSINTFKTFKNNIRETWPNLYHMFQDKAPGLEEGVGEFFFDLAKKSCESRNNKPIGRNDLVDFLLKFKELGYVEGEGVINASGEAKRVKIEATDVMLASEIFIFFAAGFETSASTLAFTFYELAKNPDIQQRLYEEIEAVLKRHNNEITYEAVHELKYMEMCTSEVLRKYPLLGHITRECMHDYEFGDYNVKVEKGTRIHIPVWAIHYDPKYYPQPEKFDPERFSAEEVQKRPGYTFLGFGEGHRICIGARFAKLQVSVGLITVLRKFRVEKCSKTAAKLKFDARAGVTTAPSGMEVRLVPR